MSIAPSEKTATYNSEEELLVSRPQHSNCGTQPAANAVPSKPCPTHEKSAIPVLQAQLQRPQARNALQVLSLALMNLADGRGCTECSLKEVARTVTLSIRELKSAKKNGEFSKEEKKAMKAEVKATFKELKDEVKRTWKDNKS